MLPGPIEDDRVAGPLPRALAGAMERAGAGSDLHWSGPVELAARVPRIGMIGTREPTTAGAEVMGLLAGALARSGAVIVSGAALGVDMAAHAGAIRGGGATIACLPQGLHRIDGGRWRPALLHAPKGRVLLLSPFGANQWPTRQTPVIRNRLIAALSEVLVVGEASMGSGTFHCLGAARRMGVPVFFLDAADRGGAPEELLRFHRALEARGARRFRAGEAGGGELPRAIEEAAARFRAEALAREGAQTQLFDP